MINPENPLEGKRNFISSTETVVANYIEAQGEDTILSKFFGIDINDLESEITEEERRQFFMYVKHVGKRIVAAYIREEADENDTTELMKKVRERTRVALMHDIAHSAEKVSLHKNEDNSPLQTYFSGDTETQEKHEGIDSVKEELYGGIFAKAGGSNGFQKPLSLAVLEKDFGDALAKQLKDPFYKSMDIDKLKLKKLIGLDQKNFDEYVYTYFIMLLYWRDFNGYTSELISQGEKRLGKLERNMSPEKMPAWEEYLQSIDGKLDQRVALYDQITEGDLDEDLLEILKFVWENRNSKRVLVDLFFTITEPYFNKLNTKYASE